MGRKEADTMSPHAQLDSEHEVNSSPPGQNGGHFAEDILKYIFVNGDVLISLKFIPSGPGSNIPALVQIMAWRRPGDQPLSEPMLTHKLTHICCTRGRSVNLNLRQYWKNKQALQLVYMCTKASSSNAEIVYTSWRNNYHYCRLIVATFHVVIEIVKGIVLHMGSANERHVTM